MDTPDPARTRPVLYLDLDDTMVAWAEGKPHPAHGVEPFLSWAFERFEVRWLTSWAPTGCMEPRLVDDLAKLTGISGERLRSIRGLDWEGGSKVDGIAWLEHAVLGRPFLWIEDATIKDAYLELLERHGWLDRYRRCDVSREPDAVERLHRELLDAWGGG